MHGAGGPAGATRGGACARQPAQRRETRERGADARKVRCTALEYPERILVRRFEHGCEGLCDGSCAVTAIRDPITGQALAVLDVSSWGKPLPDSIVPWLRRAVGDVEAELREQALRDVS